MLKLAPGATLGILGGGQLGRMLALAVARLGYRVHIYSPEAHGPASMVAANSTVAQWEDAHALAHFAENVDVITYEFENIPRAAVELLEARGAAVFPSSHVLAICQPDCG
jgi:5-(carboxyamino)imidazole ribonucleotide synthase